MNARTVEWIDVGAVADVPPQGARTVRTPRGDVGIFRTAEGALHALSDRCPHKGGPLSQGIVHGASVTCPLHGLVISLATGRAEGSDARCAPVIPLRLADDRILLDAGALRVLPA